MRVRRVVMMVVPVIVRMTMVMIVPVAMIRMVVMAMVFMVLMVVMVVMMVMPAAAIRAMFVNRGLSARWRIHHRLQPSIGYGIQEVAVFAAERGRGAIVEGGLQIVRLSMAVHRRPG